MNTPHTRPSGDDPVDALLARRYRDTTPEFEARWVALKRELRTAPPPARRWTWLGWGGALALGGVAVVALALLVFTPAFRKSPVSPTVAEVSPRLAELFAMEAVLGRATVLLDAENRDALLHLPVPPQPRI